MLGKLAIIIVAGCALAGCTLPVVLIGTMPVAFQLADRMTGGLVLGVVCTAMMVGHFSLNSPTMKLEPLKRLIVYLAAAVMLRMSASGSRAWMQATTHLAATATSPASWGLFLALRWLAGLVGVL